MRVGDWLILGLYFFVPIAGSATIVWLFQRVTKNWWRDK